MRHDTCNNGKDTRPSVQELLQKVPGVEVLEMPFPKVGRDSQELVIVRPTGKFFSHAFLLSTKSCSDGNPIHFEVGGELSKYCYSLACYQCAEELGFRDPRNQRSEEAARRKYLGLPPAVYEEELEVVNKKWWDAMQVKFAETLANFCDEKDISILFMNEAGPNILEHHLGHKDGRVKLIDGEEALKFLCDSYSKTEVLKAFHFVRSVGNCDYYYDRWAEKLK